MVRNVVWTAMTEKSNKTARQHAPKRRLYVLNAKQIFRFVCGITAIQRSLLSVLTVVPSVNLARIS